ncbi:hypothetical protein [Nocardia gipuzkoensis]
MQLVDHREDLVAEHTLVIARLRWHLHELDPGWLPPGKLERASAYDRVAAHFAQFDEPVARLAMTLIQHCRRLTIEIDEPAGGDRRTSPTDRAVAAGHRRMRGVDRGEDHREPPVSTGSGPRTPSPVTTAAHR